MAGSTELRSRQLSKLAGEHLSDRNYAVRSTDNLQVHDAILVLTKSVLKETSPETLNQLHKSNNCIIADFLDMAVRPELLDHIDILMASSICQLNEFRSRLPSIPCQLVTHHVDTRMGAIQSQRRQFAAGYFGELDNAKYVRELAGHIEFVHVDTSNATMDWMAHLGGSNLHYAVRNKKDHDGHKPFLKGFIAAHCGANVLVPRSEDDAVSYLTGDYPYLIGNDDLETVRDMLGYARETFGSPEWKRGLEIMAEVRRRTSREWILREFETLLAMV